MHSSGIISPSGLADLLRLNQSWVSFVPYLHGHGQVGLPVMFEVQILVLCLTSLSVRAFMVIRLSASHISFG